MTLPVLSTAEKIATVVLSHRTGALGIYVDLSPIRRGMCRVIIDGRNYIVIPTADYWHVRFKGFSGIDRDLEQAARLCLEADNGADVSRDYRVTL